MDESIGVVGQVRDESESGGESGGVVWVWWPRAELELRQSEGVVDPLKGANTTRKIQHCPPWDSLKNIFWRKVLTFT